MQGYRVNINTQALGFEYYKLNIILDNYDKLLEYARMHPNIIYIDKTISELDFEIDVEIEGKKELFKLINEMKSRFNFRDVEIFSLAQYYKLESLPQE